MAKNIKTELVDDLDGSPAEETVRFGLDNAKYEIDLSAANAEALRSALAQYVSAGRKASGKGKDRERKPGGDRGRTQAIRTWAIANGYALGQRGRIPTHIVEAYDATH